MRFLRVYGGRGLRAAPGALLHITIPDSTVELPFGAVPGIVKHGHANRNLTLRRHRHPQPRPHSNTWRSCTMNGLSTF